MSAKIWNIRSIDRYFNSHFPVYSSSVISGTNRTISLNTEDTSVSDTPALTGHSQHNMTDNSGTWLAESTTHHLMSKFDLSNICHCACAYSYAVTAAALVECELMSFKMRLVCGYLTTYTLVYLYLYLWGGQHAVQHWGRNHVRPNAQPRDNRKVI